MLFISIGNYSINFKKKIKESNFLIIKKNIFNNNLKIKKNFILLNIKQIIFIKIYFNFWKKIFYKNLFIKIINIKKNINCIIESFLKLFLISLKIVKNNCLNLNNLFLFFKNIIWTNIGCFCLKDFFLILKKNNLLKKNIIIESIDKIPFLTKYIIINNIRISNTNRVRLGSYISNNVTIMSEGYINFNTFIGNSCMIEGRVSAGVYIDNFTDLGGSSSIMGTLSGGGSNIISIGKNCLLGANSGIGISLGNNCIIESGLYITSGIKLYLILNNKNILIKAKKLNFLNNLTFYRNSINGKVECCKNNIYEKKINFFLHKN